MGSEREAAIQGGDTLDTTVYSLQSTVYKFQYQHVESSYSNGRDGPPSSRAQYASHVTSPACPVCLLSRSRSRRRRAGLDRRTDGETPHTEYWGAALMYVLYREPRSPRQPP